MANYKGNFQDIDAKNRKQESSGIMKFRVIQPADQAQNIPLSVKAILHEENAYDFFGVI